MTPGQGPDQTLPPEPRRPLLSPLLVLAAGVFMAALLCSLGWASVQDSPDGFPPGLQAKPQPPKVVPWVGVIRPTEPVEESEDEGEEVILDLTPLEEIIGLTCQDSVEDCVAAKTKECGKHPPQPGASAVHLAKVTRFELGKTCQFICADGIERSCIVLRGKPKPKPEDTALTP